jgi:hypothetical protein
MNKTILLTLLSLFTMNALAQNARRVLFLGNSYTAYSNLPQMTATLAASAGDTLIMDSNTPGGYTLQLHSTDSTSLSKIMAGNWDYVVLQAQSQEPSLSDGYVFTNVFPYAHILDSIIHVYNPCAQTMFFRTWGRKNGDADNCSAFPPVCTYPGMDSMLRLRYMMMADSNDAVVAPVGSTWKYIRENFPSIELYQADESHPSLAGSYAAVCTFYASIFRKNPVAISNDYSLSSVDAANIRAAAKEVAYDSLLTWNIGEFDPAANFDFTINSNYSVSFTNLSTYATDYYWSFGDGDTSTSINPVHIFPGSGTYNVTLVASHCNYSDTIIFPVIPSLIGINTYFDEEKTSVYPNPVHRMLYVYNKESARISLFNSVGQVVYSGEKKNKPEFALDLSSLADGIYFLKITHLDGSSFVKKIIKELKK